MRWIHLDHVSISMGLTHVLVHIHTIGSYCNGQDLHAATGLDIWLLGISEDFFYKTIWPDQSWSNLGIMLCKLFCVGGSRDWGLRQYDNSSAWHSINLEDLIKVINKIYFLGGLGGLDAADIGGVEVRTLVVWRSYTKKSVASMLFWKPLWPGGNTEDIGGLKAILNK